MIAVSYTHLNEVVDVYDNLAADGVNDAFAGSPAVDTGGKGRHFFVAVIDGVKDVYKRQS